MHRNGFVKTAALTLTVTFLGSAAPALAHDFDNNPPGLSGGAGTNWENPPGKIGGPGASPNQRPHFHPRDRDNNPPGMAGGAGTNWENPPGRAGGPGASPNVRPFHGQR
jgi:hypothetical protein